MALAYCDACGALIPADRPRTTGPEGTVCETCAAAAPPPPEPAPGADELLQFPCCYCRSLLRLRAVAKKTRIRCPRCDDHFYLHPDGRVEAKLEGGTTAVMAQPLLSPGPLTPSGGSRPQTPPLGALEPPAAAPAPKLDKTQPLKREQVAAGADQHALLEGLKPIKRLDFLAAVPDRPKGQAEVDVSAYAGPVAPAARGAAGPAAEDSGPLDLLPNTFGPGEQPLAPGARPKEVVLRPSEEGQVDLDAEGLKRKTKKYTRADAAQPSATRTTKRRAAEDPAPPPAARATEKRKAAPPPPDPEAERAAQEKREAQERRAAEAARRAQELERQQARRGLSTLLLGALAATPLVVALLLVSMTSRGAGFASRGVFGEKLRGLGGVVDRGVRSLGSTVNPALPEGVRLPEPERR